MVKKKQVFISYQFKHDSHYKNLLLAWDMNKKIDFHVRNHSLVVNSTNASVIKSVLTHKIKDVKCVLVIVGKNTRKCRWVKWEIDRAKELNKKIIAVKTHPKNISPPTLHRSGTIWVNSFHFETIKSALLKI